LENDELIDGENLKTINTNMIIEVGDKIKFRTDKQRFTVIARNERFIICTKPFNLKRTVLYTVVDLENDIRGTENLVFGAGAETQEQCNEMLKRLASGETEISHRNYIRLDVESVQTNV
jgi:hypothetical protein